VPKRRENHNLPLQQIKIQLQPDPLPRITRLTGNLRLVGACTSVGSPQRTDSAFPLSRRTQNLPAARCPVLAFKWSWRRDLNPRPSDYKSDALPAELRQPDHYKTLPGNHREIRGHTPAPRIHGTVSKVSTPETAEQTAAYPVYRSHLRLEKPLRISSPSTEAHPPISHAKPARHVVARLMCPESQQALLTSAESCWLGR
jgi:hypothetical protein